MCACVRPARLCSCRALGTSPASRGPCRSLHAAPLPTSRRTTTLCTPLCSPFSSPLASMLAPRLLMLLRSLQVGGRQDTPAYLLRQLRPGHAIAGPAMLIDDISTVVVEPRCTAHITAGGDIRISVSDESAGAQQSLEKADPIQLAIFSHRCAACLDPCPRARHLCRVDRTCHGGE